MSSAARQVDRPPPSVPARPSFANMRAAAQGRRACDVWEGATQAVMGTFVSDLETVAKWLSAR